jgi:hypothetical protein
MVDGRVVIDLLLKDGEDAGRGTMTWSPGADRGTTNANALR